jgi:outer membrane putative beta-barrel porin/alpha-amylase
MQSAKMTPRFLVTFTVMLLSQSILLAVSPLVTDDADTVEAGKLQLNCDFQFVRTSSTLFYLVPINPVLGLTPRLELGAIFGYQWRDGSGSFPTSDDADDLTDLTIAPKFRLWQGLEDKLKFSARMDLELPIASDQQGLGTGNSDIGLVGIATYTIGKTSLDFNAGYYAISISRADFDDDRWFVGQTIRQMLNEKWTLLAEVFAFLPNTRAGGHANWFFSGAPQWSVRENISFSALVGSAAGRKSPDLTGTLEVTLTF